MSTRNFHASRNRAAYVLGLAGQDPSQIVKERGAIYRAIKYNNKKPGHLSMHRAGGLLNYERDLSHSSPRQPQPHVGGKTLDRNGRIKLAQGPWLQPACCAVNTLPAERKRLRRHALAGRDSVAGYLIVQKHV